MEATPDIGIVHHRALSTSPDAAAKFDADTARLQSAKPVVSSGVVYDCNSMGLSIHKLTLAGVLRMLPKARYYSAWLRYCHEYPQT